jgi:hypothetical protein
MNGTNLWLRRGISHLAADDENSLGS